MSEKSSTISVRVSYLCKICGIIFKSVSTYCSHKIEHHHSPELLVHNKCLVFEESESSLEQNDNELGPSIDPVVADKWQIIQLDDLIPIGVKQESPEPVIFHSDNVRIKSTANLSIINHVNLVASNNDYNSCIKTEWVEDTSVKYETSSQNEDPSCHQNSRNNLLQGNKDYENTNYYSVTETQSSFIGSDADMDARSHGQVNEGDDSPNPLEDFNLTQSSQSTATLTTTEIVQKYLDEKRSDSDDDIICLDDSPPPPPPSTVNKFASSTGPTPIASSASNSFIFSHLKLQCHICAKQFKSSAQFGIHVTICKLYNKKIKEPGAGPSQSHSRSSSRSLPKVKRDRSKFNNFVNCEACSKIIRRCNLNAHLRKEHNIFVEDSDRKYVCDACGSAFPTRKQLTRHAKVHSDERPFVCSFPGCSRAFKEFHNLKHHMKNINHPELLIN